MGSPAFEEITQLATSVCIVAFAVAFVRVLNLSVHITTVTSRKIRARLDWHINAAKLLYTTNPLRLAILFIPPLVLILTKHVAMRFYDSNTVDLTEGAKYVFAGMLSSLIQTGLCGSILWAVNNIRCAELENELLTLTVQCGTQLSRANKDRIARATKNMGWTMNAFMIPLDMYRAGINAVISLCILPDWTCRFIVFVGLAVMAVILRLTSKYIETDTDEERTEKFDQYDPKGYHEHRKTKGSSAVTNITEMRNTNEVLQRIALGHKVVGGIQDRIDKQKMWTLKSISKNMIVECVSSIMFVLTLNFSTKSVAHTICSLCFLISYAVTSTNNGGKIYLFYEFEHLIRKLREHAHRNGNESAREDVNTVESIELNNVSFDHLVDILVEPTEKCPIERQQALKSLSHTFRSGKLNYITGENGAGKSSLFKALLYNITTGNISFNGIDRSEFSFVQLRRMIYHLNQVNDNPVTLQNDILIDLEKNNSNLAAKLDVSDLIKGRGQCSGGQQQRLHVFTALASGAPIVFLDEPFSALDAQWKTKMEDILIEESKERMVLVIGHGSFNGKDVNSSVLRKWTDECNSAF